MPGSRWEDAAKVDIPATKSDLQELKSTNDSCCALFRTCDTGGGVPMDDIANNQKNLIFFI